MSAEEKSPGGEVEAKTLQVPLKGADGEDKGRLDFRSTRLDGRVRYRLIKEATVMYAANKRVGTHETKTRGEIAGSTKKPWRQKGTGRARAGTRKSPLWRGGGTVFGPHMRDYSYSINKKQRRLATRSALLSKFVDGQVVVMEGLHLDAPRTREVARALNAIGVHGSCLIGTDGTDKNLVLSARNLPGVFVSRVKDFNALDLLKARTIVLTREAFDALQSEDAPEGERTGEASREGGDESSPPGPPEGAIVSPRPGPPEGAGGARGARGAS